MINFESTFRSVRHVKHSSASEMIRRLDDELNCVARNGLLQAPEGGATECLFDHSKEKTFLM